MATPTQKAADTFCLQDIIQYMKSGADRTAEAAAKTAREDAEAEYVRVLRRKYGGKTLYCYDESHENRFAHQPIREWNAIGLSLKECVDKARAHVIRYEGEDQWSRIERQLEGTPTEAEPRLEPEQRLVFQAGSYWYCFFCVDGDAFCDLVVERLACERKEDSRRASQSREGIDVDSG